MMRSAYTVSLPATRAYFLIRSNFVDGVDGIGCSSVLSPSEMGDLMGVISEWRREEGVWDGW